MIVRDLPGVTNVPIPTIDDFDLLLRRIDKIEKILRDMGIKEIRDRQRFIPAPCPFCSNTVIEKRVCFHDIRGDVSMYQAVCNKCDMRGPKVTNENDAFMVWNKMVGGCKP